MSKLFTGTGPGSWIQCFLRVLAWEYEHGTIVG